MLHLPEPPAPRRRERDISHRQRKTPDGVPLVLFRRHPVWHIRGLTRLSALNRLGSVRASISTASVSTGGPCAAHPWLSAAECRRTPLRRAPTRPADRLQGRRARRTPCLSSDVRRSP